MLATSLWGSHVVFAVTLLCIKTGCQRLYVACSVRCKMQWFLSSTPLTCQVSALMHPMQLNACVHTIFIHLSITIWSRMFSQDRGTSLASNQVQYSLLYRAPETNGVKQACEEGGTSLIAYSPLAQGLLTGRISSIASICCLSYGHILNSCMYVAGLLAWLVY